MHEIKWDIKRGAEIYRTVYDSRLKHWITTGGIKRGDILVWRSGFSGWYRPEDIEELKLYFKLWEKKQLERAKRARLRKKLFPKREIKNILIIDNEKDLCDLLSSALTERRYNVAVANTRKDAIDCLKIERPDLVFLDLKLPDGDGLKLIPVIRRMSPKPLINIISAYGSEEKIEEARRKGVYDFINKPFSEGDILKRIRMYQRGRKRRYHPSYTHEVELAGIGS